MRPSGAIAGARRWSLLPALRSTMAGADHRFPAYLIEWMFQAAGRSFMPPPSSRGTQRRRNSRGVPSASIAISGIS